MIKSVTILIGGLIFSGSSASIQEIELECVKRQHAVNACHYNFLIDGQPYRYIDNGCKQKKNDIVKKAKDGKLALARDWKIECNPKDPR